MVRETIKAGVMLLVAALAGTCLWSQVRDRRFFAASDQCMACHNGLVAPSGEDVSIGFSWRSSMMANAARDPYWQGAVRREVLDHPQARTAIEDKCATCHMPMARFHAKVDGEPTGVFSYLPVNLQHGYMGQLAADGASCTVCHQILDTGFGSKESFTGGFVIDTGTPLEERRLYGPYDVDTGRQRIMQSASGFRPHQAVHVQSSEFCATCHTLYTHALGPNGEDLGELPEQVPYLEWRHSGYRETRSCQSCHMQDVEGETAISSVLGQLREGFSRHVFRGGNFLMLRILNRYRHELGVVALQQELEPAARQTLGHLATGAARITIRNAKITGGRLELSIAIGNLAGHKLPTAYPSRRVWIRLRVRDHTGSLIFESGAFRPDGSIVGNDNDKDPGLFEPHYERISRPEDVQIYEAILVDHSGAVTTGLLSGLRYTKDNRLLPAGFEKRSADRDIAVQGEAAADADFRDKGDQIDYEVGLGQAVGPFTIEAELWYQPIAYRWALNLARQDAPETRRFISYYKSLAKGSATILARDTHSILQSVQSRKPESGILDQQND